MTQLFQARYPASRAQREVWLAVLLAHVLGLWLIHLYWPVHRVFSQAVVQIFRASSAAAPDASTPADKNVKPFTSTTADSALLSASTAPSQRQRGITAQRRLQASMALSLPTLTAEQSTPLQTTSQLPTPQPSRKRSPAVTTKAEPLRETSAALDTPIRLREEPAIQTAASVPAVEPAPIPTPAPVPVPLPPAPQPPAPVPPVQAPAPPPAPFTASNPSLAPASAAVAALPSLARAPATASGNVPSQGAATVSSSGSATGNPTGSSTGSAIGATTGSAIGSPAGPPSNPNVPQTRPPLDLRLPSPARPTFPYTPPNAQPRRSISEMANEQLRRDRPGKLEAGIENAGDIDCTKDATAQGQGNKINDNVNTAGLMNIGPLLKRTLEEKCKK